MAWRRGYSRIRSPSKTRKRTCKPAASSTSLRPISTSASAPSLAIRKLVRTAIQSRQAFAAKRIRRTERLSKKILLMPIPLDQRRKPASVKIHVSTGAGVDIAWADGHASHFEFAYLREQCPCATCNDERIKKESLGEASPAFASSPALPMFKPKARAQSATPVGQYAFQLSFSDCHSTGIYSYDHLRSICPCLACLALREH